MNACIVWSVVVIVIELVLDMYIQAPYIHVVVVETYTLMIISGRY